MTKGERVSFASEGKCKMVGKNNERRRKGKKREKKKRFDGLVKL